MDWIACHNGRAEAPAPVVTPGGLHGSRHAHGGDADAPVPVRFVLPAGALA